MKPDIFHRYNNQIITGVIILTVVVFIIGISNPNNALLKVAPFVFSTGSLLLTLKAFDQFGVRKIIAERQVKAVVELLDEIENSRVSIFALMPKQGEATSYYLKAHQQATKLQLYDYLQVQAHFYHVDYLRLSTLFDKYLNNRFLPLEVKSSLNFLPEQFYFYNDFKDITGDYVLIDFNERSKYELFVVTPTQKYTHEQFIDDFSNIILSCEEWINKRTNVLS